MSWINPGLWSTLNVGWAVNKSLKEDGVPSEERKKLIAEATGLDEISWLPKLVAFVPKGLIYVGVGFLIYKVLDSRIYATMTRK